MIDVLCPVGSSVNCLSLYREQNQNVPKKIQNRTIIWPNDFLYRDLTQEYKNIYSKRSPKLITELSIIAKIWKNPKCLTRDKRIKKLCFIETNILHIYYMCIIDHDFIYVWGLW